MPSNAATTNKNPGANLTAAAATSSTGANGNNNSNAAAAAANNENRGLPYYEKLRRELRDTLQKKRLMDKSMVMNTPISRHSLVKRVGKLISHRPNSKNKSTALSNHTSKTPAPAT